MILVALAVVIALFLWTALAGAASMCAGSQGIAQTSVQLKASGDISTGRHYIDVQNMGNNVLCCGVGTGNAVSTNCTNGHLLVPTQLWVIPMVRGVLPDGDISCVSPIGTGSASACDY